MSSPQNAAQVTKTWQIVIVLFERSSFSSVASPVDKPGMTRQVRPARTQSSSATNSTSIKVAPFSFHTRMRSSSAATKRTRRRQFGPTCARPLRLQVRCFLSSSGQLPVQAVRPTKAFVPDSYKQTVSDMATRVNWHSQSIQMHSTFCEIVSDLERCLIVYEFPIVWLLTRSANLVNPRLLHTNWACLQQLYEYAYLQ